MAQTYAALITAPGTVELLHFTHGTPGSNEVVVDIHLCGVCVAEVKSFRDGTGHGPSLCGHEWVGRVADVGPDVTSVATGDRVVIAVPDPCGDCPPCRAGRPQFCTVVMTVARGRDDAAPPHGAFAQRLTVADYRVLPVDQTIPDESAALLEPAAVAYHGVQRAELSPRAAVVVLGAGPIGLLTLQVARAAGADVIIAVDPESSRQAAAQALAADAVFASVDTGREALGALAGGTGPDVVFDCAGTTESLQQAVDVVRPGGRVVMIGDPRTADIAPRLWLAKEVTVVAAAGYSRQDIREVMALMADGAVSTGAVHSRTISIDELGECLHGLAEGTTQDIKVLVDPRLDVSQRILA